MRALKSAAIAAAFVFAAVSLAEEEKRTEIRIAVDDGADGPHAVYSWSGADMGVDMHEMQEGETRSFVDDAGRSVLITREADGMKLEVDGKTMHLPLFYGEFEHVAMASPTSAAFVEAGEFDVQVMGDVSRISAHGPSGVTIITDEPLDASTRESIKAVLLSVGRDDEVRFVDKSKSVHGVVLRSGGEHEVKIVRKQVEITN